MLSKFYRRKLLNFRVIRALDYLTRILLSIIPILHTKLKKPVLIEKKANYYFLIINGGLGDFIIHFNLLNTIPSKNSYVVLNKNSQELSKLLFPQINFIYYDNINFDFIKKLKKITSNISKETLYVFTHPIIENYFLYLFLGFKKGIGFIGNFKKIRTINYKSNKTTKLFASVNSYERIDQITESLNIKTNNKNSSLNKIFKKSSFSNFVLINPNKTNYWPAGRWNSKGYIEVIKFILSKNYNILLIGSNDEYLNNEELKIHVNNRKIINLASKTTIPDLFNIIKKAKVVVTNDNSTSHIAALLDKKVITLFSFSDPKSFSPPKAINIYNNKYDCMPCIKSTNKPYHNYVVICPYNSRCDESVSPRQVINELDKII